jgi:RimJ/RimL family protein N-acetyltransferase
MSVDIPTLTTDRLVLRPFVAADAPALAALNADPNVARFISLDGQPLSAEDSWRQLAFLIGHWQLRGFGMWAAVERSRPDLLIGRIGCHQPEGWPDFEIGWALASDCWGRGYATEGARAAMRYAFETLGRPRVVSLIDPANERSVGVAERLGERPAGEWNLRGRTVVIYAIDRATWRLTRPAQP